MPEIRLTVDNRTEFGKGGARRTRRAGKIPAVIYGHGGETRHVALPAHDFANAIRKNGVNALLTLDLEGKDELAIAKAIQRHPIKPQIEHVDLLAVRRGEKVTVEVPLQPRRRDRARWPGQPGVRQRRHRGRGHAHPVRDRAVIEGKAIGTQITAGDLELPEGSSLTGEADQVLVVIARRPTAEEIDADVAEAAERAGHRRGRAADRATPRARASAGDAAGDES